jgi:hypothetical protein
MPNKAKFIGDVFEASMDVAFEMIKDKWDDMLKSMVHRAIKIDWMRIINPVGGAAKDVAAAMGEREGAANLGAAQQRLNGLLAKLKPAQAPIEAPFQWQGPREPGFAAGVLRNMKPKSADIATALGKMFTAIGKDPITASVMSGASGMLDRAKIQAGAIAGTFSNWFNSPDWDKEKQQSHPQLAGAMQQGSQEAYSTLVQNMLTRSTDPIVKATQEQTKQLVKAWTKKAVGEKYVALMSMPGGM